MLKKKTNAEIVLDYNLFDAAVKEENINDAIVIGSNLLNQNPKNGYFFLRFFDQLCDLALNSYDLLDKDSYYRLANDACSSFILSMNLTSENIALVAKCRNRLLELQKNKMEAEMAAEFDKRDMVAKENKNILEKIRESAALLESCESVDEIESISKNIVKLDNQLDHDFISELQNEYDELMKEISEMITKRNQVLQMRKCLDINRKAVETYRRVLEAFHRRENEYVKDLRGFYSILDEVFQYDEIDLFPETITYYSYVYNYVISTVDEKQKYYLTSHMIEAKGDKAE